MQPLSFWRLHGNPKNYKTDFGSVLFRKRNDVSIKDVEKKRGASQEILTKLQQHYQQLLTKAAAKAW